MLTPPSSAGPGAAAQACAPTPPDSPMGKFTTQPSFTGELDSAFERFALKCSGGECSIVTAIRIRFLPIFDLCFIIVTLHAFHFSHIGVHGETP